MSDRKWLATLLGYISIVVSGGFVIGVALGIAGLLYDQTADAVLCFTNAAFFGVTLGGLIAALMRLNWGES